MKRQSLAELEAEMRAVARGEIPPPADAAEPSVNSAEATVHTFVDHLYFGFIDAVELYRITLGTF